MSGNAAVNVERKNPESTFPLESTSNGFDSMRRLENVEDVIAWCHQHEGKVTVLWQAQHKLNDKVELRAAAHDEKDDRRFASVELRVTAVEKRIVYWAGLCAGVGSLVGAIVSSGFLGVVGGPG